MSEQQTDFAALGWRCAVDPQAGELHLEHADSDTSYVVDAEGNLTVPGGAAVDGAIEELQETLSSALAGDAAGGHVDGHALGGTGAASQSAGCNIECDSATGEVTIESDTSITLDASTITLDADAQLSLTGTASAEMATNGVMTFDGSLIQIN